MAWEGRCSRLSPCLSWCARLTSLKAICEKLLGSFHRECLDQVLILGQDDLRRMSAEWVWSHGKMLAHYIIAQLLDGSSGHAAALLENAKLAGHPPGKR